MQLKGKKGEYRSERSHSGGHRSRDYRSRGHRSGGYRGGRSRDSRSGGHHSEEPQQSERGRDKYALGEY